MKGTLRALKRTIRRCRSCGLRQVGGRRRCHDCGGRVIVLIPHEGKVR